MTHANARTHILLIQPLAGPADQAADPAAESEAYPGPHHGGSFSCADGPAAHPEPHEEAHPVAHRRDGFGELVGGGRWTLIVFPAAVACPHCPRSSRIPDLPYVATAVFEPDGPAHAQAMQRELWLWGHALPRGNGHRAGLRYVCVPACLSSCRRISMARTQMCFLLYVYANQPELQIPTQTAPGRPTPHTSRLAKFVPAQTRACVCGSLLAFSSYAFGHITHAHHTRTTKPAHFPPFWSHQYGSIYLRTQTVIDITDTVAP